MIRQLAAAPGDTVCECASGDEAVRLAPSFQPDCITMDVSMPGMCSFDAVRAIRTALPSTRIVVVTSYDEALLRRVAREAGVADYLVKDNLCDLRDVLTHDTEAASGKISTISHSSEEQIGVVDVANLVAEVWYAGYPEALRKRIQFKAEQLPEVCGERARLRVVFENLLANAVKFTAQRAQPVIEVGCTAFREKGVFFVRDNGAGFDVDHAERLFQPLSLLRAPANSQAAERSLPLVRRIVEEHGGRMWVEAGVDRGATFYFTLPLKAPSTEQVL
jgi:signal transduction histidine kinase